MATKITVPDIGDFENVEIIEVLAKPGDLIKKNDPIVTLESDKSCVEVPSPFAGKISSLEVKIGDKVSKGSVLAVVEDAGTETSKELKEPKKGVPFITALGQSFNPQRGGAIFRGRQERLQDELEPIDD